MRLTLRFFLKERYRALRSSFRYAFKWITLDQILDAYALVRNAQPIKWEGLLIQQSLSACRKSPPAASSSEFLRCFPLAPMGLPGGKRRKETLHSKASESAAHVAGFGLHLEGFSPPNLPEGFFDSLKGRHRRPFNPIKSGPRPGIRPGRGPDSDCQRSHFASAQSGFL